MDNMKTEEEELDAINGLYVGMLSDEEMELFNECVSKRLAYRAYEGTAGLMGLAKVRKARDDA